MPKVAKARAAARSAIERTPLGRGMEIAAEAAEIPGRLLRAMTEVEDMLSRVRPLIDRLEDLTERAAGVLDAAGETVGRAAALNAEAAATIYDVSEATTAARAVVESMAGLTDQAGRTVSGAEEVLGHVEPVLARAAPLAEKFATSVSQAEVEAAIRLVDELPALVDHLRGDILPILATLERAGPDLSELVRVSHDVRRAVVGIPGFSLFRRRGEDDGLAGADDADFEDDDDADDGLRADSPAAVPSPFPPEVGPPGSGVSSRFTDAAVQAPAYDGDGGDDDLAVDAPALKAAKKPKKPKPPKD